jgi:hypothetical protein
MAIGRRLSYRHRSDCTTSPGPIVYDDRLAESMAHGFRKNARLDIQTATRWNPEDPSKRFGRKALPTGKPRPSERAACSGRHQQSPSV